VPHDDEPEDLPGFSPPPLPDDRLWRHPSELGSAQQLTIVTPRPDRRRTAGVGVLSGMIGAAAMLIAVITLGGFDHNRSVAVSQIQVSAPKDPAPSELAIADRALPAVARVDVVRSGGSSSGTAIVFRNDGHLLTTAEVVEGADLVSVQLSDGRTMKASVVGVDRSSDLAVLKIDGSSFQTAVLGVDGQLQLGEPTIAIESLAGKPGAPNVSVGLISALRRRVDTTTGTSLHDMIQTNVRITESGAGAVLIDSSGAVIGLLTHRGMPPTGNLSVVTDSTSKSATLVPRYATPIDYAKQVADELILTGRVAHPWLGVKSSDLSDDQADRLGRSGARIDEVDPGSPAADADLHVGDVIVAVDGDRNISSSSDLVVALRRHHPGDSVGINYLRGGDEQVAIATLVENGSLP
jgi:putative serine protease PepD